MRLLGEPKMLGTERRPARNIEAVSKLKKCQEKCDFHGDKKAVADEIRAALRWRACHANPISPI